MGWTDKIMNVLTLGGHGNLQEARRIYEGCYACLVQEHRTAMALRASVTEALETLGLQTEAAMRSLHKACRLLTRFAIWRATDADASSRRRTGLTGLRASTVLQSACAQYRDALGSPAGTLAGAAAGGTLAYGAWAVVSVFGVASTGTPIAVLSGAAAHNAILACLGGGALAAGGGGMAAGSLVLGGLVLVPMVAAGTWYAYKKAAEFREETQRIEEELDRVRKAEQELDQFAKVVAETQRTVTGWDADLNRERCEAARRLYRFGFLSHWWRCVRAFLGGTYAAPSDASTVQRLDDAVTSFVSRWQAAGRVNHPVPGSDLNAEPD